MAVTIYTRKYCSYCVRAKRLLDDLQVIYNEIAVDRDSEALSEMKQQSGRTSVPQIWIGQNHVGGCDELMDLHASGHLVELLNQA